MLKTHENFHSENGKRRVLIIDDETVNREILNILLKDTYETLQAGDGETALQVIRQHQDVLSLILLDLLMPGMNGLDVLRILKNDQELKDIPVIVLTADQEAEVTSLQLGATDFIPKPYPRQEVILARVERAIELYEDRDIIHSTERDSLTGLYNREYFYRYAEQYDQHHPNGDMDAVVIDIQHFRMINERYGKEYGDEILRRIGEKVRDMVRESGGIVSRREADTFLVYCPHREEYDTILNNASVDLAGENVSGNRVRLRMGVYEHVDRTIEMERRFDRAKMAADTVRGSYIKSIAKYDSHLHETEIYEERLLEDFPRALEEGEFTVFYQPKFDIRPEIPVLASAEALVRWQHPDGMISPGVFIPLFEANGLIQKMDMYVWRSAAAQIKDWKDRFGISVPVSVNVSRIDMYDPHLIDIFKQILKDYDLEPGELLLEITESAYTQDSGQIISTVNQLREIGFKVEMDDFGTGYSSLNMISSLPIDALKLDMKFIRNAFREGSNTRLIEIIVDIAKYLGVPIIAEGVETVEQLEKLRELGCDMVQGFYFSKPVPADEYEQFVEEKKRRGVEEIEEVQKMEHIGRTVSASITSALTSGFESIYYVNTETGQYVEFSAKGQYADLQIERNGRDFFGDTRSNIPRVVYSEDQERVALSLQKDVLLAQLLGGGSFTMTYRLMISGTALFYNLLAVNAGQDEHHIVIGVSNVNDQITEAREHQAGAGKSRAFFTIAQALSSDFESIYYVDTVTNEYTEFAAQGPYADLEIDSSGKDFFAECQKNILEVVYPEDVDLVSRTTDKENLLKVMEEKKTHSIIYRLQIDGKPSYYQLKIAMAEDGRHIVIGVANVQTQIMRDHILEASRRNSLTYASIAQALAADYFSIYYVDIHTDRFIEFSAHEDYRELGIEEEGEDFFELSRKNMLRIVHPEDQEMMLSAFTKDNLLEELKKNGTFTLNYRLLMGDRAQYVNMKAIWMSNKDDHIVIGVSNIDAQMRRERELHLAREKANRDALTGVKSKHAYDEAVLGINREISLGESVPFAVAVCDVNGLKHVNDTMGHEAGDSLIKDASRRICEIFKHSPVFRIGGDEFIVIMKGKDFERRQDLVGQMEEINQQNKKEGGVIVACGYSDWQAGEDTAIEEVFRRADAEMYNNKTNLKQ